MKSLDLYKKIRDEILSGLRKPDTQLPNTRDMEALHGVSQTTVIKAMARLVQEGYILRVPSKGTFVRKQGPQDYLESQRKNRIGLIFRGTLMQAMRTTYLRQTVAGAEEVLLIAGKHLHPIALHERSIPDALKEIEALRLAGVFIFGYYNNDLNQGLKALHLPIVGLDMADYNLPFDQVTNDHLRAGTLSARKLMDMGHRRILVLGHQFVSTHQADPDHRYWAMAIEAELKSVPGHSCETFFIEQPSVEKVRRTLQTLVTSRPDATGYICCSNSYLTILKELIENTPTLRETPRDAIVFTEPQKATTLCDRPVYQCQWDVRAMGQKGADIMLALLKGGPYRPAMHHMPVTLS